MKNRGAQNRWPTVEGPGTPCRKLKEGSLIAKVLATAVSYQKMQSSTLTGIAPCVPSHSKTMGRQVNRTSAATKAGPGAKDRARTGSTPYKTCHKQARASLSTTRFAATAEILNGHGQAQMLSGPACTCHKLAKRI